MFGGRREGEHGATLGAVASSQHEPAKEAAGDGSFDRVWPVVGVHRHRDRN